MDINKEKVYFENLKEEIGAEAEKLASEIENEKQVLKKLKDYVNDNFGEIDQMELTESLDDANNMVRVLDGDMKNFRNLTFLKDAPYFARLDYKPENGDARELRIGSGGFWSSADKKMKVLDWRSPISRIYYEYDLGPASYTVKDNDSPGGESREYKGEIVGRAQLVVKDGSLNVIAETGQRIADELLLSALSGNAPEKMRPVIATIQKEQNSIIRDDESKVLVADGRAGSGKTVIAMHRLAWLLYNMRGKLNPGNILILSPNNIFSDYISAIMPELMEENLPEKHWDELMDELVFIDLEYETGAEQAEAVRSGEADTERLAAIKLKNSKEFYAAFDEYVEKLACGTKFKDFRYEKTVFPKEKLEKMFFESFKSLPPYERFHNIAYFILDDFLLLSGRNFTEGRQDKVQEQIRNELIRRFGEINIIKIYTAFLEEVSKIHREASGYLTPEGKLRYEDMQAVFWLQIRLYGCRTYKDIKHVMIDEMQDYGIFRLGIIKMLFDGRITFLGDRQQVLLPGTEDVVDCIKYLWPEAKVKELNTTYRSTAEITRFCNGILGEKAETAKEYHRHGSEPVHIRLEAGEDFFERAGGLIKKELPALKEKYDSIALLGDSEGSAYELFRELNDGSIAYLSEQNAAYRGGVCCMAGFLSKGMEFDAVIVVSEKQYEKITEDPAERSGLYIACSRALHELTLISVK